jgi:hypothetical protein
VPFGGDPGASPSLSNQHVGGSSSLQSFMDQELAAAVFGEGGASEGSGMARAPSVSAAAAAAASAAAAAGMSRRDGGVMGLPLLEDVSAAPLLSADLLGEIGGLGVGAGAGSVGFQRGSMDPMLTLPPDSAALFSPPSMPLTGLSGEGASRCGMGVVRRGY